MLCACPIILIITTHDPIWFTMPLILQLEISSQQRLAVWEATETEQELLEIADLGDSLLEKYRSIKLEKRRQEWLVAKALLSHIGFNHQIEYLENGKPVVPGITHFSLSHCLPFVAFTENRHSTGLDIQTPDPKLERIQHRIFRPEEVENAQNSKSPLDYLTILWSAKEAVFKIYGENIHFAEQMKVLPFQLTDDLIQCIYFHPEDEIMHELKLLQIKGHWCVVAL